MERKSNEELARLIQSGQRDRLLELWAQVRRFALWRARRWARLGRGVTVDDLEQEAFIALLDALERWREADGPFLAIYNLRLKAAFTAATGQRTQRDRMDPLDLAASLDAPVGDDQEGGTLEEFVEDLSGGEGFEAVEERDTLEHLRADMEEAMGSIPAEQREILRRKYYMGQEVDRRAHAAALRAIRAKAISGRLHNYRHVLG